jgi:hypothetical protein
MIRMRAATIMIITTEKVMTAAAMNAEGIHATKHNLIRPGFLYR